MRRQRKLQYPSNWKEISLKIRDREGWKCKWCGAPHGEYIQRYKANLGMWRVCLPEAAENDQWRKAVRVVLTVAHLENPDPMDVREDNLAALCQRCHNCYDMKMRHEHAKETRARKKREQAAKVGQLELFNL